MPSNDMILGNPALPTIPGAIAGLSVTIGVLLPFVVAPVALTAAWLRARDPTIRTHLRWFAYAVVLLGSSAILGIIWYPLWPLGWAFAAYCLFRSARSLVVVSRLPSENLLGSLSASGDSSGGG